jgi:hypothetical protein
VPTLRTRQSYPTLPLRGKSTEIFPLIRGDSQHPSPSRIRREKTSSCHKKNPRTPFAFSLPQDSQVELMFGARVFADAA